MPPMRRGSMVAQPWRGALRSVVDALCNLTRRWAGQQPWPNALPTCAAPTPADPAATAAWKRAAVYRRGTLLALVAGAVVAATAMLNHLLPRYASDALRDAQITLFALLLGWVAAGFFTALMGFWVQWRGDPHALSGRAVERDPIAAGARTALLMPICNENVATVFSGLRASIESLVNAGGARLFDVYLLSDTSDPAIRTAELAAWAELRAELDGSNATGVPRVGPNVSGMNTVGMNRSGLNVYYRWRQRRTQRKSGNLADFCRRWGRNYRYMVVLDADSVMTGDCLLTLIRLMEAHPDAGIIQTAPQACGLGTVHARAQQFAGRVTGRLFSAGMQYWQLGESHYWGHNAIVRVQPFMAHCALAPLPGRGGLSGAILSHDFVEAALMRRAGYHVWLVHDLAGSYEQPPPNLLEELQRDRRWCQGNLQNGRLIAEPGLHGVHRAMLATGAMAYLSAPLWLAYLMLGLGLWLFAGQPLFGVDALAVNAAPVTSTTSPIQMLALWAVTLLMLVMPRALGVAAIMLRHEQAQYGGTPALLRGALMEGLLSVLQAPLRMVAHTLFVVVALTGLKLDWKSPPRVASDVGWADAAHRFAAVGALMLGVVAGALALDPASLLWLAPVGVPLLLAVPLAVLTSRAALGDRVRAWGLLVTPEETRAPSVLNAAAKWVRHHGRLRPAVFGWRDALDNPWLFDVVRAAMGQRDTLWGQRGLARRQLVNRVHAAHDIDSLSTADRMRLLSEPQHLARLRDQLLAQRTHRHAVWAA
jgi:membrane glycosyltransferase